MKINGKVSKEGIPLISATVFITKNNLNKVVAYSLTDDEGRFSIVKADLAIKDSLIIHIKAIGCNSISEVIKSNNQIFEFSLRDSAASLPEIKVKSNLLVRKNNDTINYIVGAFKNPQDRTIMDILKKLPGVDVDESGKIFYNGKAISEFYIDGDNLLDDRYGIATKTISVDMVDKIQVLENHQPIKVLKDAGISNKVAINLNLKDKARLKGSGNLEPGIGNSLGGLIYDENANILVFKNRYKAINSIKTNNIGQDYLEDFVSHNQQEYENQTEHNESKPLLNNDIEEANDLTKQQYIFNNTLLINTNNLFKTESDLKIKSNFYYLDDKGVQNYTNISLFYLPSDTAKYFKKQNYNRHAHKFYYQININDNKPKHYLNSTFVIQSDNNPNHSLINTITESINQTKSEKINRFSGEIRFIKIVLKKFILEGYSYLNYSKQSEALSITPGINSDIFNNNQPYKKLEQISLLPDFFSNNFISFRKSGKNSHSYLKIGFIIQRKNLNSVLNLDQSNGSSINVSDSFENNLKWNYKKIFTEFQYTFQKGSFSFSTTLPISNQHIDYYDTGFNSNLSHDGFYFKPSALFKYQISNSNYLTLGFTSSNKIGKLEEVYSGYILKNYLLIENNSTPFKELNNQNFTIGYNYRNPTRLLFINISEIFTKNLDNSITTTSFYQSLQKQSSTYFNNNTNGISFVFNISKYVFNIHSTISIKTTINSNKLVLFQNNSLDEYRNYVQSINTSINSKITDKIHTVYEVSLTNSNSKSYNYKQVQSTQIFKQKVSFNFSPKERLFLNFNAEHIYVKQNQGLFLHNYLFCNASILYKSSKKKSEFSLQAYNLTDIKQYSNAYITGNNLLQSNYQLRPRMILFKVAFNF